MYIFHQFCNIIILCHTVCIQMFFLICLHTLDSSSGVTTHHSTHSMQFFFKYANICMCRSSIFQEIWNDTFEVMVVWWMTRILGVEWIINKVEISSGHIMSKIQYSLFLATFPAHIFVATSRETMDSPLSMVKRQWRLFVWYTHPTGYWGWQLVSRKSLPSLPLIWIPAPSWVSHQSNFSYVE